MRLCAIFCVWDDWYMLKHSVENIRPVVDGIIIIGSEMSNFGERSEIPPEWRKTVCHWEPKQNMTPMINETDKRNYGIWLARDKGYTHFIMLDADEFYQQKSFIIERERFYQKGLKGLVCATQVYFKSPTLTIGLDTTIVPFIHELTPTIMHGINRSYPYAWKDGRHIRIDPTRQLNIKDGVEWCTIVMHHMSWVRKDYPKKIRNSTARTNLERSTIMQDLVLAKEGYFCKFYGKALIRASVDFNIPEYGVMEVQDFQPVPSTDNPRSGQL